MTTRSEPCAHCQHAIYRDEEDRLHEETGEPVYRHFRTGLSGCFTLGDYDAEPMEASSEEAQVTK